MSAKSRNETVQAIHRARSAGFTLIEVIMSLALTTMLLGLLSTGVYIVADDWNRNSDILDEELDEALVILQLERALQAAFPHSFTNRELLARQIHFTGDSSEISWVSSVSPQRTPGLMAWYLYSERDEGVFLTMAPAMSDDPLSRLEEAEPILILPGYTLEVSYSFQDLNESKSWTDEWEARELNALPLAVYIRFEPEDDAETPLEIIARIRNNEHRSIRPNDSLFMDL